MKLRSIIALCAMVALTSTMALAVDRTVGVGKDFATVQAAVSGSVDGDVIKIDAGTYAESVTIPAGLDGLVIEAADPNNKPVIDGPALANAKTFTLVPPINGITFRNLYIKGNPVSFTSSNQNSLIWSQATVADFDNTGVVDMTIEGCVLDGNGSWIDEPTLVAKNCSAVIGSMASGYGPFGGFWVIKDTVIKNCWDWRVIDPHNGSQGTATQGVPFSSVLFENVEAFNNGGAIGFRCDSDVDADGVLLNIRNCYMHDWIRVTGSGGAGVFKLFWAGVINLEGCTIENVPNMQAAQFDTSTAQGGALLVRDRRQHNIGPDGIAGTNDDIYNASNLAPTIVNMRNNIFRNCVQALYIDLVPAGSGPSWTNNTYVPSGTFSENVIDDCNFGIFVKNLGFLDNSPEAQAEGQLEITDNTFGGDTNGNVFIRTGFESGGEQIIVEDNFYGANGLSDAVLVEEDNPTTPAFEATTALTAPNVQDEDGDGIYDTDEDLNGNGVYDPATDLCDFQALDTDGDGLNDGLEVTVTLTDPKVANAWTDADNDGAPAEAGLDPDDNNPDTDGDGYKDGYELTAGTDPNSAASKPLLGDVNGNGKIDNVDAVIMFQAALGNLDYADFAVQSLRMDVNLSGAITVQDAIDAFDFFLGNINLMPSN